MHIQQFIYILCLLYTTSDAIQCKSKGEKSNKEKSCTGDACINVLYRYSNTTFKDCLTGFNYTGCETIDNTITYCFCYTDNCNSQTIDENEPERATDYNCSTWSKYSTEPLQEQDKSITIAPLCSVEGTESYSETGEYFSNLNAGGFNSWNAQRLKFDADPPELDFKSYYYIGGAYAFSGQNDDLHYAYKCHGEMCNDKFHFSWVPKSKDVTCFKSVFHEEETPTCQGEFCVFAVRSDDPTYNISYCMHTNQTKSDGQYKIGMYKFKNAVNYICKTDNCNINKAAAIRSIKEFPNGNLNTLTTSTPILSTGIPLDSQTAQYPPQENTVVGYCRFYVVYILFTSFFLISCFLLE